MAATELKFDRIGIQGHSLGALRLTPDELVWTSADSAEASSSKKIKWSNVTHATWAVFGDYCHLRLMTKDGQHPVRLDGFAKKQYQDVDQFLSGQSIRLSKERVEPGGMNYGEFEVLDNMLRFSMADKTLFDLNIKEVSQCVMPGTKKSNDVELQFQESDTTDQFEDSLVAIRVSFPGAQDEDGPSPAEELQKEVMERANIHDVKGKVLVEFDAHQGIFENPRGRYAMEMYSHFLRLHGASYDYKIQYTDISRLFLLDKPDERYVAFVLSLDKPIRQGQQKYQHLVYRTTKDEATVVVNMSEADLKEKYDGHLDPEMTGPLNNLVAKVFKILTGKSVFVTGKFLSYHGAKAVKCALGAYEGLLYPLNKSFIFIHKPTCIIGFDEIDSVEFQRYGGAQGAGVTRNFDLCVTPKGEGRKPYTFSGIDRAEYTSLYKFLSSKKLRIKNIQQTSTESDTLMRLKDLDDQHDPYKAMAEGEQSDEDESEDDADYAPPSESDGGEPSGSDSDEDQDSGGSGDDQESKPRKKTKAKASKRKGLGSPGGGQSSSPPPSKKRKETKKTQKKKKKKKKDPNAPKKALPSYMWFCKAKRTEIQQENPSLKMTEIGKVLGERWKQLDADGKQEYVEAAEADKVRYKRELEEYKQRQPDPAEDSGSGESDAAGSGSDAE